MMQHDSALYEQFATRSDQPFHDPESISPLRASVDPRFSSLLNRASVNRERLNQQQGNPTSWAHSSSAITINTNAWTPVPTTTKNKATDLEKKKCLTPVWKNRLQGLLVGLAVAAITTGIALAVSLTRPWANSVTSTTTTAPTCSSLQWNPTGVNVAGNGTYGNASNQLWYPMDVYVDSNNAIYVADYSNHRIQQWVANAVTGTTVAGITGTCGSGGGMLCYPRAIYGDSQQNLYIADNNGIYLWPLGSSVGTLVNGSSTYGTVYGVFVDKSGNLYASVTLNYTILMWRSTSTAPSIVAGGNGCCSSSSQLNNPYGLTVDSSTNIIYVANSNADTIVAWQIGATSGSIVAGQNSTVGAAYNLLRSPRDVKRDSNGNLYVADTTNNRVLLFCQNPPTMTGVPIVENGLSTPQRLVLDSSLNVYVVDYNHYRIVKFNRII